jgi:uncharacterized protein (DUF362 family)
MPKPLPRTQNVFTRDGKPIVAKAPHLNGDYLPDSVGTALDLLGGLSKAIRPGDRVMVKPNFNCSYAFPLSTDRAFLAAAIEILQDAGAHVTVGEMCGRADWPTEKVIRNLKIMPVLERYGVPFVNFEHDEWLPMEINSRYWQTIHVPRSIYEAEKRVYLANMRCHSSARYTAALKLCVGFTSPEDRDYLHCDRPLTELKAPEINLAWQPDLVLLDGRRSTVNWDGRGEYVFPNVIMASGDMVALDVEAVKILQGYPGKNKIGGPAEELGQIKVAAALGLGSLDYTVIEAAPHLRTEQESIHDPDAVW